MATDLESVLEGSVVADMSRELDWPWPPIIIEEEVEEVTASGARSAPADTLLSALSGSVLVVFRLLSEEPSDLELTLTKNIVLFCIFYALRLKSVPVTAASRCPA